MSHSLGIHFLVERSIGMTDLDLSPADLSEFEADFDTSLAIPPRVQDLLFRDARTGYAFT